MPQPTVAVRGEAVLEVEPELAQIWVAVTGQDPDRGTVVARLNERTAAVRLVLDGFGAAVDKVETSAVHVGPRWKQGRGSEKIVGYRGTVRLTITLSQFDRLGELLAQLAAVELVEVDGPSWSLRPGSLAPGAARIRAVRDAVLRAREYAAALGSELGELIELTDAGLSAGGGPHPRMAGAFMAMRKGGGDEEFTFDIEPVAQTVTAQVEARFLISPPDLTLVSSFM